MKEKIKKREKETLQSFFGREFSIESLKLKEKKLKAIKKKGLDIHYLPALDYKDFPQKKLSKFFVRLKKKGKLKRGSLKINPGWRAVEEEPKPQKEGMWLRKNFFFDFLDSLGVDSRRLCRLSPSANFEKWGELEKRFGTSREEISLEVLKKAKNKIDFSSRIRLPYYLEYVYLGKSFYQDWGETKTWEWLQDELKDGRFLASGFKDASKLGADPKKHWSTILGFRLLVQLNNE